MADADVFKRKRTVALGNFTRTVNHLTRLLADVAPSNLVDPYYEKVKTAWEVLEAAHDEYLIQDGVDLDAESKPENDGMLIGMSRREGLQRTLPSVVSRKPGHMACYQ